MTLLLAMLPVYILGNLHCIGMCGPIAAMLGRHPYRVYYLVGRIVSFSLAGFIAGFFGAVLHAVLEAYHIPALTSFMFGTIILVVAVSSLLRRPTPGISWISTHMQPLNRWLSTLMLRERRWPTFLFGFFTIALPCGQTVMVYSACALSGDSIVGLLNGFVFAVLTTPALLLAMQATGYLHRFRKYYNVGIGVAGIVVGVLACCRGLAELDIISHWILNPNAPHHMHVVMF